MILDQQGNAIDDSFRALEVAQSLSRILSQDDRAIKLKPLAKKLEQFKIPTKVSFVDTRSRRSTLLEIVALDRPGLLGHFATIFQECELQIHSAKITTFGEKAEDVFIVSNAEDKALSQEEQNILTTRLCEDAIE